MSTLAISIIVGIATGVLANLFTHLFVYVWLPSYRNFIYRGYRVDGSWVVSEASLAADDAPNSHQWVMSASLSQRAHHIVGSATATRMVQEQAAEVNTFTVSGEITDRFVALTFHNNDVSTIAYSVFLLEVEGDGSTMKGYRSFYGRRKLTVRAIECLWHRGSTLQPSPKLSRLGPQTDSLTGPAIENQNVA